MPRFKSDGTPDMRFSENRQAYLSPGRTVSGGYDMRYSSNKSSFASPSPSPAPRIDTTPTYIPPAVSSYSSDMRLKVNRELIPSHPVTGGPTKKDGTPDMRYKQNKEAVRVSQPKTIPEYRKPAQKPSLSDMRLKENRAMLPKDPFTGARLNLDGSRDMRCSENRKLLQKQNVDGTPDMRYKKNNAPSSTDWKSSREYGDPDQFQSSRLLDDLYDSLYNSQPREYRYVDQKYTRNDSREEAGKVTKSEHSVGNVDDEYDDDEDVVEPSDAQEKTQLIKKDGKSEYINIWYRRLSKKEEVLLKGRASCLKYDKEHLNADVEEDIYEPISYGWQVNQIQVGEQVLMLYSEDDTVTFPELKRTLNKGEEIIHGPDEVSGRDKENGEYAIGCVTLNHGKGVDYTWFLNDEEFTSGKDLSVIHVEEEGSYHCVVKYKGRREKSSSVEVVSIIKVSADIKMNKEDMTFDEEIGAGSFGTVWKGKWKGTLVSIKEVPLKLSEVPQEVEIARKLRHPNIVALFGVFITKVRFYMVNQYIYGDNLNELLHHADEKPKLKLKANGYVAYQVALGLQYLHTNKIVHQDLKPANILVEAKSRKTYICDFGLAKQRETLASASSTRDSNFKGTLAYCAKESLEGSSMKSKPCVDVYSYGCVLYEIYTRKMVWEGLGLTEVMTKILTGRYPSLNDIHDDTVKDVLSMIFVKAEQRPTMDDILPDIKCLVHNRYAEYI